MSIYHNCVTGGCYKDVRMADWKFLDNVFPRGIKIGDIDGIVEYNGNILIIEYKYHLKDGLENGQKMMFTKGTKGNNRLTFFIVSGTYSPTIPNRIRIFSDGKMILDSPCNGQRGLVDFVNQWKVKQENSYA